jgi:hypothetical protein
MCLHRREIRRNHPT